MSSVTFHFEDVALSIGGRERHWMGGLCRDLVRGVLHFKNIKERDVLYALYGDHMLGTTMNTACAVGSRAVRLAAHVYARCELSLVIDGAAFPEVVSALEEGLATGVWRRETQGYDGIEAVLERFRKGGRWCALSCSITDGFPRRGLNAEDSVAEIWEEGHKLAAGGLDESTPFKGDNYLTMSSDEIYSRIDGKTP